eukprot:TRINITY_DN19231_c0_g2_i2.p1 TRINITY_DN19231_c0_g2~~TRINITY_DN19231_c0_g2_i2.p1  ORF type:complete len:348 (-),score=64.20 TRINITY_DN19231_c0_g2_i2:455-1498(-)
MATSISTGDQYGHRGCACGSHPTAAGDREPISPCQVRENGESEDAVRLVVFSAVAAALLVLGAHGAPGAGEAPAAAALARGIEHLGSSDRDGDGEISDVFSILWPLDKPEQRTIAPDTTTSVRLLVTVLPPVLGSRHSGVFVNPELLVCQQAPLCSSKKHPEWRQVWAAVGQAVRESGQGRTWLQPRVLQADVDLTDPTAVNVYLSTPRSEGVGTREAWLRGWSLYGEALLMPSDSHTGLQVGGIVKQHLMKSNLCASWDQILDKLADEVERSFNGSSTMPKIPDAQGIYSPQGGERACEMETPFVELYAHVLLYVLARDLEMIAPDLEAEGLDVQHLLDAKLGSLR